MMDLVHPVESAVSSPTLGLMLPFAYEPAPHRPTTSHAAKAASARDDSLEQAQPDGYAAGSPARPSTKARWNYYVSPALIADPELDQHSRRSSCASRRTTAS